MKVYLTLLTLCVLSISVEVKSTGQEEEGKLWVLLVAGSSGFDNYRHQADVCHSYQIVKTHGVPEENIIVMMEDDIAYNDQNPNKGVIINRPNGPNVYPGVPKDYNGDDNNPSVFMKVLSGVDPKVGSSRVINSTSKDRIFVYFSDHGGPGILGFKENVLTVQQLTKTLVNMKKQNKFKELVFYVEACESGSMFDEYIKKYADVYAMTASNDVTSSYACYYDKKLDTYLGDVYSVNWLEDADRENLKKETIEKQFNIVKKETNTSEVCQFGDIKLSKSPLSEFLGDKPGVFDTNPGDYAKNPISSRNATLEIIRRSGNRDLYELTLAKRRFMEKTFERMLKTVPEMNPDLFRKVMQAKTPLKNTNEDCYFSAIEAIHKRCFNLAKHEYALQHLQLIVNLCYYHNKQDQILWSINKVCRSFSSLENVI